MTLPGTRWFTALRRDVRFAAGARVSPFAIRSPRAHAYDGAAVLKSRRVIVRDVVRETADAITLFVADERGAALPFLAGQFFTLLVPMDSDVLRRAYSASSSPRDPSRVGLTVKRVAGGRVSNHLVDTARVGDAVDVLGPSGQFVVPADGSTRPLVLVAGGSGITPLLSILREVLETEPARRVTLVYANRSPDDVIFRDALAAFERAHASRFSHHALFGATLDPSALAAALDPAEGLEFDAYLCGPEPMMRVVRSSFAARGIDAARVHEERYAAPHARAPRRTTAAPARVTVRIAGKNHAIDVAAGQTLLEAGLLAELPMPFSCALGGCGACRVKVCAGVVDMDEPTCLTDDERAKGYALACVGTPSNGAVVETR